MICGIVVVVVVEEAVVVTVVETTEDWFDGSVDSGAAGVHPDRAPIPKQMARNRAILDFINSLRSLIQKPPTQRAGG